MATCSPSDLLASGACFQCLTKKELQVVIAQLLCEIAAGGGGGGASCFQCYSGAVPPVASPANPNQPASYNDTVGGFTYNWDIPTQSWLPIPKVYRALLSQSGANAPVATVLENTLGGVPIWSRASEGNYTITLAGAFPIAKTFLSFVSRSSTTDWRVIYLDFAGNGDNYIDFRVVNGANPSDDGISAHPIEILVYP